jgi:ribose transport system substrate-binding protein
MRRYLLALPVAAVIALAIALTGNVGAANERSSAKPLAGKTIWFADVTRGNAILDAYVQGVNSVLAPAGATVIRSFALNSAGQLDLSVEAQAIDRAITRKPAAIVYWMLDPKSMKPQIKRAKQSGIATFALFAKPTGYTADGWIDLDHFKMGVVVGNYMAQKLPRGSQVTAISPALPIPAGEINIDGVVAAFKKHGLKFVGNRNQQRDLTDDADGGRQVMQGVLQRFPDLKGVYGYNDQSALGGISAIKAAGKKGQIVVASRNGVDEAIAAIKKGELLATCDIDPIKVGQYVGRAVLAHLTGKTKYANNRRMPAPPVTGCLVNKTNVNSYVPWKKRVHYAKIKEG